MKNDDGMIGGIILLLFVGWIIWLIFVRKPKIKQTASANALQTEMIKALNAGTEKPEMILFLLGHDKSMAEQSMLLRYYNECVNATDKYYSRLENVSKIEASNKLEIAKIMAKSEAAKARS